MKYNVSIKNCPLLAVIAQKSRYLEILNPVVHIGNCDTTKEVILTGE